MRIYSFRVRRDGTGVLNLEQKMGLFDPATDNPGTAFTPIMPDVEDFQVAYLYSASPNGTGRTIFNTFDPATSSDVLVNATGNVPPQAAFGGGAGAWDITMVSGIRTLRHRPLRAGPVRVADPLRPPRAERRPPEREAALRGPRRGRCRTPPTRAARRASSSATSTTTG